MTKHVYLTLYAIGAFLLLAGLFGGVIGNDGCDGTWRDAMACAVGGHLIISGLAAFSAKLGAVLIVAGWLVELAHCFQE